jgi:hypothetical protein
MLTGGEVPVIGSVVGIALLSALLFVPATATSAEVVQSGSFNIESSVSRCSGTWSFDGSYVTISGQATDKVDTGEPASCVFVMQYADDQTEPYASSTSTEGPFEYTFSDGTDAERLIGQACKREWTGMDQCEWPPQTVWQR